jgi:cobyrinic acid a,c-diamide synthase
MSRGLVIAAPSSGAGKTMIVAGLLAALRARGVDVRAAKSGPDYIDGAFHAAASGLECVNLDAWAMAPAQLRALAAGQGGELLVVEGAMGLFDGAPDLAAPMGRGSVAELAGVLDLPVVLVIDASRAAQTAAVVAKGLADALGGRADASGGDIYEKKIVGVVLNRVGSARHEAMLRASFAAQGLAVLGSVPRDEAMERESRHLGLVQAGEDVGLAVTLGQMAALLARHVDLDALLGLAKPVQKAEDYAGLPVLGQRISVARDRAFAFAYPHILNAWRAAGAEILPFSPLADERPEARADAVFLPGGYPELYAGVLADTGRFRAGMVAAVARDAQIYGECGGYMVLGNGLVDALGQRHAMLGLLPVETSFAQRKMTLGYRHLTPLGGPFGKVVRRGHEFHYATIASQDSADPLWQARDSLGADLGGLGQRRGRICGAFAHVIA